MNCLGTTPSMGDYGGGADVHGSVNSSHTPTNKTCDTCARYNQRCNSSDGAGTTCDTCRRAGWTCVYSPRKLRPTLFPRISEPSQSIRTESEPRSYDYNYNSLFWTSKSLIKADTTNDLIAPYNSVYSPQMAQDQAQAQAQGTALSYAPTQIYNYNYNYNPAPAPAPAPALRYMNPRVFFPTPSSVAPYPSPHYAPPPPVYAPAPAPAPTARYPTPAAPIPYANNFSYFDYVAESEAMTDMQRVAHREHLEWLLRALEEGEKNARYRLNAG